MAHHTWAPLEKVSFLLSRSRLSLGVESSHECNLNTPKCWCKRIVINGPVGKRTVLPEVFPLPMPDRTFRRSLI